MALALSSCGNDTPRPSAAGLSITSDQAASVAPSSTESPEDRQAARDLAQSFADALRQDDPGQLTPADVTCLVDQVTAHLDLDVLQDIASSAPDPASLPPAVKAAFLNGFDRCLPPDVVNSLRAKFGA